MRGPNNRGQRNVNDEWLTPPELLAALGPFDLDPCCPPQMPWRTARRMLTNAEVKRSQRGKAWARVFPKLADGLLAEWRGRVLLNNPYSDPLPWMTRMAEHGRGVVIAAAKSTDSRWGQKLLSAATSVLFLDDRISFCHPDGRPSGGKWAPYLLAGFGSSETRLLRKLSLTEAWKGVLMVRAYV